MVTSEKAKIVALLHDVLEDLEYTFEDLRDSGVTEEIVDAVTVLTKPKNMSYNDYLNRVKGNSLARQVKLADLHHNSDLTRLKKIEKRDLKRVEKYRKSIAFLSE